MTDRVRAGGPYRYALRPDSNIGGEVYERMLLERLPAHGVDLILGVPRDLQIPDPPAAWTVEPLGAAASQHWLAAPLGFTPYALRLIRERRVDVLRGHSVRYCGPALLLAARLARRRGRRRVPVVLHHHHLSERWARLEAAILARADAVVTVSEHARAELLAAGVPPELIHVVLQGVARPAPTGGWPEAWPSPTAGLRLLALGRLERRKRPELAIDALAALLDAGTPASLVMAGEGPLAGELAARAQARGVQASVRFLGRVGDADKWRLYDAAHALIFTSALEGFGVVAAEAQSRGVPVVAVAGTATEETLAPGRSGLLVEPGGGGEAFAAALARLADGPFRDAMSAAARESAARFDWDRCAAEVAEIYRELARSSTLGAPGGPVTRRGR